MENIVTQNYFVYTTSYPDGMDVPAGTVFYVGKASSRRILRIEEHITEAVRGIQSAKCDIIRRILAAGKKVVFTIVAGFDNEADAYAYEKELIYTLGEGLSNVTFTSKRHEKKISYSRPADFQFFFEKECTRKSYSLDIVADISDVMRIVVIDSLRGDMQPEYELVIKWISALECPDESARYILDVFGHQDRDIIRVPVETYSQWDQRKKDEKREKTRRRKLGITEGYGYTLVPLKSA